MAYDHYQIENKVVDSGYSGGSVTANLISSADIGIFNPAYQPVIARAFAVVVTEALGTADATVELDYRPTANSDTGRVQLGIMTIPQSDASVGDVFYNHDLTQQMVKPGEELVVETDGGASTTGAVDVYIFVQPCWDHPANNTGMTELNA